MRNRDGRPGRARNGRRTALGTVFVRLAGVAAAFGLPAVGVVEGAEPRWALRALAADSGCVVLDDGHHRALRCAGERLDPPGLRLLRVEPGAAVFEIDTGVPAPLAFRILPGQTIDADALRARLRDATGARPGWIEIAPTRRGAEPDRRTP